MPRASSTVFSTSSLIFLAKDSAFCDRDWMSSLPRPSLPPQSMAALLLHLRASPRPGAATESVRLGVPIEWVRQKQKRERLNYRHRREREREREREKRK